jgi:hypothetical protein
MRSSNVFLWMGLLTASFSLATPFTLGMYGLGARCKTTPCTYFDKQNKGFDGTCGGKKDDNKNCYCFNKADKKLAQIQSGCSLSAGN